MPNGIAGFPVFSGRGYLWLLLFAFYAGGMRFSDVGTLRWKHLRGGRLFYRMKK